MQFISEFLLVNDAYLANELQKGNALYNSVSDYINLIDLGVSVQEILNASQEDSIDILLEQSQPEDPVFQATNDNQPYLINDPFDGVQVNTEKLLSAPYTPMDNVKEQVNLVSGDLEYSVTDVVLPGAGGLDLVIGRQYNSKYANYYTAYAGLIDKANQRNNLTGLYTQTKTILYNVY